MEVQTFFLATQVEQVSGSNYQAACVAAHNFFPQDRRFPLHFTLPYFMLLRREGKKGDEEVSLRFNMIDLDGNNAGLPKNFQANGIFPAGHKFMVIAGTIEFLFLAPGDYSLEILADEEKMPSLYSYYIEIDEGPS